MAAGTLATEALLLAGRFAVVALAAVFAAGVRRLQRDPPEDRLARTGADALWLGTIAGAAVLLLHLLAHPAADLAATASDLRALVFAALAGAGLARLPVGARLATIAAVSLGLVGAAAGTPALALNLGACVPGYALVRFVAPERPRLAAALQAALFAALVAALVALRLRGEAAALGAWGLLVFVGMRHASFAADARGAPPVSLPRYLAYLVFYPSCLGAMEVFREFRAQNLETAAAYDTAGSLRRIGLGFVSFALALHVEASMDAVLAAPTVLFAWASVLRLFLRSALAVGGLWGILEGGAGLLGIRLRPNFRGILLAESPSAFWHAWRGTMTRWLTLHVYVPLGGSRAHRTRNAAAAFAVSTAWHCGGVAMLRGEGFTAAALAPVVTWGLISFGGVALHAALRARRPPPERTGLAAAAVRAVKIGGTWIYGSFTVTLLDLSLGDPERFARFARRISGLG